MARWPHWDYLVGLRTRAEQREREREIMASGCCNPSCWFDSRHEYDNDLAAKNITHVLARGRTLKHLMSCFSKVCVVSWAIRKWVKLNLLLFFSIIWRDIFCDFVMTFLFKVWFMDQHSQRHLEQIRDALSQAAPQTQWLRFCMYTEMPRWFTCTLGPRSTAKVNKIRLHYWVSGIREQIWQKVGAAEGDVRTGLRYETWFRPMSAPSPQCNPGEITPRL